MNKPFNWPAWWASLSRRMLRTRLLPRISSRHPANFRLNLVLDGSAESSFGALLQSWQERDFAALDPAWMKLAGRRVKVPFRRAWIERPRGHSKTSDMAVQIAWILLFAPQVVTGLAAAADRDQAALIADALRRFARANERLFEPLQFQKHLVANRQTGSSLEVISSDVGSSWGALPDFVICDELSHWEKPELWHSLLSSAAKRADCLLAVLTNAGVGRGWQWQAREAARTSRAWYFSSLDGPQAPWITPEHLREQRDLLPPPVYQRLWGNRWQHGVGSFVTLEEAQACRDPRLAPQTHGQPGRRYVAAIDYAEKHDYTVGVIIHRDTRIVVDRMDVVVPRPGEPTRVAWVEDWIRTVAAAFHRVTFIVDEYQLLGAIQSLERTHDIRRFEFRAGRGNHALAVALRKLILHREVAWYPGCGRTALSEAVEDDLETELASLVLRQSPSGLCRIDHLPSHHDDRAFALGAACLHLLESDPQDDWLHVTPPGPTGGFDW